MTLVSLPRIFAESILLLIACMVVSTSALAINKCTDAAGSVSYQDADCETTQTTEQIETRSTSRNPQELTLIDRQWGLRFLAPSMRELEKASTDGNFSYLADSPSGLVMSVFVEPAAGKGSDKLSCGNHYWQLTARNPAIIARSVDKVVADEFIVVSYGLRVPRGDDWITQGNYNIYGFYKDSCIDIHLSKLFPTDAAINFQDFIEFATSLAYVKYLENPVGNDR
jgi:hypothetical protein